ncbi:MAG TPA: PEGA domain-containing protein [Polyangiales bacterium]
MQRAEVGSKWGLYLGLALGILVASWVPQSVHAQDEADLPADKPAAPAAPVRETTSNPMELAREHMERGQSLYAAARYIESAEEFLRAYEAQPFAAFLYNAGVAYEKVDDPGRAADYFARFLQSDPQTQGASKLTQRIERLRGLARAREQELAAQALTQSTDVAEAARAQTELENAKKRLAELEAQLSALGGRDAFKSLLSVQSKPQDATITLKGADGRVIEEGKGSPTFSRTLDEGRYYVEVAHSKYKTISTPVNVAAGKVYVIIVEMSQGQFLGFLRVVSSVPGANVFVDKKEEGALGHTPFQNATPTGTHHIWIEKPGYKPVERDIEVGVGDDVLLKVELERVDYGRIRVVASRPDAEVYVDGQLKGKVPLEVDVNHGTHEVRVSAEGMKDWEDKVVVERGQATPVRVKLRPRVGRAGAWVTAGVGVAVLGGAIATGIIGKNLQNELDKDLDNQSLLENDERIQRGKVMYIASDVGYGLALILAGLSTYYFLRDPLPDSEGRVLKPRDWTLNPYLGPTGAGGRVDVRF